MIICAQLKDRCQLLITAFLKRIINKIKPSTVVHIYTKQRNSRLSKQRVYSQSLKLSSWYLPWPGAMVQKGGCEAWPKIILFCRSYGVKPLSGMDIDRLWNVCGRGLLPPAQRHHRAVVVHTGRLRMKRPFGASGFCCANQAIPIASRITGRDARF